MDSEIKEAETAVEPESAPAEEAAVKEDTILGGAEGTADTQEPAPPVVPNEYDFSEIVPEGMVYDEAQAAAFSQVAKDCGLSQDQAAKLAAYGMQFSQAGVEQVKAQQAQMVAQWGEDAKRKLGAQFDHTTAMAARGIRALEAKVPNIKAMLNETGAGNRIEMICLLAELGALTGDDAGHTGGTAGAGGSNIYDKTNFNKYL